MMYYDHLMALLTTTVNGEILAPVTNDPAVGTVTFKILMELRDTVDNIVYSPQTFTATLDINGQFSIVLPYTDSADITPTGWQYWVYVDTDVWTELFYIELPTALGDPVDFADLTPISSGDGSDCTPDGTACAPISIVGEVAALQAEVDALEVVVDGILADLAAIETDVITLQIDVATLQSEMVTVQGQIVTIQGQIAANTTDITTLQGQVATLQGQVATNTTDIANLVTFTNALSAQKVNKSGDTMTGDLIISNAYLRQTRTVLAGAAIPAPALTYNFATVPLISDPNIFQVSLNGSPADLTAWLNEVGHYRAEIRANYLFDNAITLIAPFVGGSGVLIRFERRDGANARQIVGGINLDGLLQTSLYSFITPGFVIDPGATGKYTILVAANVATIGGRREFDDLVRLQGRISVTAAGFVSGDVIMQVPARFIPAQNRWMNTTTSGGISVPCEILAVSGNVVCRRTQAGAANIAFDDIVYKTSNT